MVLATSILKILEAPPSKTTLLETTTLFASTVNRLILDVTSIVPFVDVNSALDVILIIAGTLTVPPVRASTALSVVAEKIP